MRICFQERSLLILPGELLGRVNLYLNKINFIFKWHIVIFYVLLSYEVFSKFSEKHDLKILV